MTLAITVILGGSAPSARMSKQDNLFSSQPKHNFFVVLDERADPGQN